MSDAIGHQRSHGSCLAFRPLHIGAANFCFYISNNLCGSGARPDFRMAIKSPCDAESASKLRRIDQSVLFWETPCHSTIKVME